MTFLRTIVAILAALVVITGCATSTTKSVPYTGSFDQAFECALGATRDAGLKIESADSKSGVFAAVKISGMPYSPNYQAYGAVDKQSKAVQIDVQSFGQILPGDDQLRKITQDFQQAFAKRCK